MYFAYSSLRFAPRPNYRWLFSCAFTVGAFLACQNVAAADALRLATSRSPLSLPVFVAQERGYFAANGVEVAVSECLGGHRCLQQVFDGQADIATTSDLPVMFSSFVRTDFAILATIVTTSEDLKVIARTKADVTRPAQLAGKRVGAVFKASSQYFLEVYLLIAGVDPRELTLVNVQPEEATQALRTGKVDAVAIWEPHGYQTLKALGAEVKLLPKSNAYTQTFNLVAHRRMLGSNDRALTQLIRAIEQAEKFIQEQPAAAKEILKARLQLDDGFVDWVWAGFNYRLGLEQSLITTLEGEARWAVREKHVAPKNIPNYFGFVHAAPLRAVKPSAVGVRP